MRTDKGISGLNILLSVIVMLFVIGLVVMIFVLMSGEIGEATYTDSSGSANNETLTTVTETGEDFANAGLRDASCTVTFVTNATDGAIINSGNYTQTNCNLASSGTGFFNNTNWNVTYTYTFSGDTTASNVINDTGTSITEVTDWFPIIIVITAMVILILLTVIIITTIRGSGLVTSA
jgi:hypothetical protein